MKTGPEICQGSSCQASSSFPRSTPQTSGLGNILQGKLEKSMKNQKIKKIRECKHHVTMYHCVILIEILSELCVYCNPRIVQLKTACISLLRFLGLVLGSWETPDSPALGAGFQYTSEENRRKNGRLWSHLSFPWPLDSDFAKAPRERRDFPHGHILFV